MRIYLTAMAVLAWLTVLTGAYIIYPWYRAVPPPGTANLAAFPQRLLMSNPSTSAWHSIGMEWKEHVAWLVPISITMAAAVFSQYRRSLRIHPELRAAVLRFCLDLAFRRGNRRLLRRHAQQKCAGCGRPDDHHHPGRPKMSAQTTASAPQAKLNPNGAGAAAVLAAGIGCVAVAVFAIVADKSRADQEPDELLQANRPAFRSHDVRDRCVVGGMGASSLVLVAEERRNGRASSCGLHPAVSELAAYLSANRRLALTELALE